MLYIILFFQGPNHLKNNIDAKIIVYNIPSNLFYIESNIYQRKPNIECMILLPTPTPLYQLIVLLCKDMMR